MSDGATASGQPMEDILASIKRIITDDANAARPVATWPGAGGDEDVLELGPPPGAPVPPGDHIPANAAPDAIVSAEARSASRQALASLASLRIDAAAPADTLDGLVRDMLRPMLKEWLDANLPDVVERVVTREVARLTGR